VIFFRDQHLTPAQYFAFAQAMGEPMEYPFVKGIDGFPLITPVVKEAHEKTNFGGVWHTDTAYLPEPPKATMLLARETPPAGGDTMFANQQIAYESLSDGLRAVLDTLTGINSSVNAAGIRTRVDRDVPAIGNTGEHGYVAEHPVVRTHPESGRKSLYVNRGHTTAFRDWSPEESQPLLQYLFAHQVKEEFTCRFRWAPGKRNTRSTCITRTTPTTRAIAGSWRSWRTRCWRGSRRGRGGWIMAADPGPALAAMLREAGHEVALYDPFFAPDPAPLAAIYDFVTCTETAEHFHDPRAEFARLRGPGPPRRLAGDHDLLPDRRCPLRGTGTTARTRRMSCSTARRRFTTSRGTGAGPARCRTRMSRSCAGPTAEARPMTTWLHEQRLRSVRCGGRASGARTVLDLGCGDGDLSRPPGDGRAADRAYRRRRCLSGKPLNRLRARVESHGRHASAGKVSTLVHGSMIESHDRRSCRLRLCRPDRDDRACRPGAAVGTGAGSLCRYAAGGRSSSRRRMPSSIRCSACHPTGSGMPDHRFEWDRPRFRRWARGVAGARWLRRSRAATSPDAPSGPWRRESDGGVHRRGKLPRQGRSLCMTKAEAKKPAITTAEARALIIRERWPARGKPRPLCTRSRHRGCGSRSAHIDNICPRYHIYKIRNKNYYLHFAHKKI
jgi:taurine dioxygenase